MRNVSWPARLAGLRRRVAAHPVVRWVGVLVLAAIAATSTATRQQAAADERAAWATSRPVVVATADIPAGGEITVAVAEVRAMPPGAVPPSALAERPPAGAVATRAIVAGEVVLAGAVSSARGPGALLPPGSTGVALPLPIGWRPAPGDEVTVYGLADVGFGGELEAIGPRSAGVLTERATIVAITDDGVLLALPDPDAGPVAEAAATGRAVLLLRRPGGE